MFTRATVRKCIIAAILIPLTLGSLSAFTVAESPSPSSASRSIADVRAESIQTISDAVSGLPGARDVLTGSDGKTLSGDERASLAEAIAKVEGLLADARAEEPTGNLLTPLGTGASSKLVEAIESASAATAAAAVTVQTATAAWTVEQDRLAADAAAKAQAEAEAAAKAQAEAEVAAAKAAAEAESRAQAERAAAPAPAPAAAPAPAPPASGLTKNVWTAGWQSDIDACRGAVDVTAHHYTPTIAEHWRCGGSSFPDEGATITLTGVNAGVYRVGGRAALLNINVHGVGDVPHGYDLLYQTCEGGSSAAMSFTVLTRIG